jgi:archaellum biogenesis ATPase FlaH/5S rRNA maturation endonuclease (ribonuclease M5)
MANAVISKTTCPQCRKKGGDTSGDNLVNYSDGGSHCFACSYSIRGASGRHGDKGITPPMPSMPLNIMEIPSLKGGLITNATLLKYEVFQLEENGKPTYVAVYPYYDLEGNLFGVKYRDFVAEQRDGKHHKWFHGSFHSFFGSRNRNTMSDTLIICEGESDTMAASQVFVNETCVGISGASSMEKSLRAAATWIRSFKRIYVCMDNDNAGKEALAIAMELLPKWRTFAMVLPPKKKDICECNVAELKKAFASATNMTSTDIITGTNLVTDFYKWKNSMGAAGGISTGFDGIDRMVGGGGIQAGEFMVLVAHTGRGKSTLGCCVAYNMIKNGVKCMWVGTEMLPNQMLIKFIERHTQYPYRDEFGQISIAAQREKDALDFISTNMTFYNNLLGDADKVIEACVNAIMTNGVEVIFIDVLQDIDMNFGGKYAVAGEICKKLVNLSQGNPDERQPPVVIIAIQHTVSDGTKESAKVSLGEIRGGGAIKQSATLILAMNGVVQDNLRYIEVIKRSRMRDSLQFECTLSYDTITKTYTEITSND